MRELRDSKCTRVALLVSAVFAVMIFVTPGAMQVANAQEQIVVPPPPMGWSW
jgi:hypothetical protein